MAAYSASLMGAPRIYLVDRVPERLAAASKIPQCTPIDFSKSDPVDQIIEANGGMVDRAVDAVGYQAVDQGGKTEKPNVVLENLIRVTRACGGLGIPGLYVPSDPGSPDKLSGAGQILVPFGNLFEKVSQDFQHRPLDPGLESSMPSSRHIRAAAASRIPTSTFCPSPPTCQNHD